MICAHGELALKKPMRALGRSPSPAAPPRPGGAPAPAPAADEPKRELTVVTPWTTRRPRYGNDFRLAPTDGFEFNMYTKIVDRAR